MDREVEEALTYKQLDLRARAIAVRLQGMTTPGERALLVYPSGLDFISAFLGCLYAGVVAVPTYPPRHNRFDPRFGGIASDAGISVVLTTGSILSGPDSQLATDSLDLTAASDWQMPDIGADTLAFLQYTSGSTGSPKGVMVSHGNLLYNQEMIKRGFGHGKETILVGWLPLFHDMGLVGSVLLPTRFGGEPFLEIDPSHVSSSHRSLLFFGIGQSSCPMLVQKSPWRSRNSSQLR
uniref:AMP-binding enzyme n=1 Tax=Candidatus Kentrum sp. FW TaxID=2126338 RepID=A0A450SMF4_9GAMM|nr:MAG: AMP-binding enzyme [Candidatus Kentron sp. FW]